MKKIIISLIFVILTAFIPATNAQSWQNRVSIANGREKVIPGFGIKIKFLDVIEDSRCPKSKVCVWAGNAKVKIQAFAGRRASTFEINSNLSPQVATINGYEIRLESLEPRPDIKGKPDKRRYIAVLAVRKLAK
jgi:hypothetical protein